MATASNTNIADFGVGSAGDDADQWSAWDASSGGTLLYRRALANDPNALVANQYYRVGAGTLQFTAAEGDQGATAAMAQRAVRGMVKDGVYVQLEDSSDNSALTGRIFVPEASWTVV